MYNQPYNYNPYMQPQYNRMPNEMPSGYSQQSPVMSGQPFTSVQNRSALNGKIVESIDVVKAMDIPMDGSISYYPLSDATAIVTKQLQMDGTSRIITYKRVIEEEKEESRYITLADLDSLRNEIKEIKDLVINNVQQPTTND